MGEEYCDIMQVQGDRLTTPYPKVRGGRREKGD
jgi:hypothetical protein